MLRTRPGVLRYGPRSFHHLSSMAGLNQASFKAQLKNPRSSSQAQHLSRRPAEVRPAAFSSCCHGLPSQQSRDKPST